jgi:hypothetical protein
VFVVGCLVVVGCVSVAPPASGVPSAAASLGVTTPAPATATAAAPTAAPTVAATATAEPSEEPTLEPTEEPTLEPSEEPTEEPSGPPSADTGDLIFLDLFDDETSGWGTGVSGAVSAQYVNGSLQLDVSENGQAVWSTRLLGTPVAVALVAGEFRPVTEGAFGPMCEADDGSLYGAVAAPDGSLSFLSVVNNQAQILESHDGAVEIPPVGGFILGLECAGMSTGALRMVAVGPDGTLGVYQTNEGPETFSGVAFYGEATNDSLRVDVDSASAYGIPGSADGMTSEGEDLLTHVPADLQSQCIEAPSSSNAVAVIHCYLQTEGTGAELLQFQSFGTNEEMDTAYQSVVDQYGVDSTGTCRSGPNETTWSLDEDERGRIQCAPQQVGVRFDWTDDVLIVLSTLVDFEGDYENTNQMWLNAGPVDNPI